MNNLDLKRVRWQQRFTNYTKAFNLLQTAVNQETPDLLQLAGIVQTFEFTFELGWKTIKDYLASEGIDTTTPREVIKQAFAYNIIGDGEVWLDALEKEIYYRILITRKLQKFPLI
jgi:nucleotidyltransferase substrate binding protein (TIGR01987 family)